MIFVQICRSAFIGFAASAVSDILSNFLRVLKTIKQTSHGKSRLSYSDVLNDVLSHGGVAALFSRGLSTRLLANGLQSILFTVIWKLYSHRKS